MGGRPLSTVRPGVLRVVYIDDMHCRAESIFIPKVGDANGVCIHSSYDTHTDAGCRATDVRLDNCARRWAKAMWLTFQP